MLESPEGLIKLIGDVPLLINAVIGASLRKILSTWEPRLRTNTPMLLWAPISWNEDQYVSGRLQNPIRNADGMFDSDS